MVNLLTRIRDCGSHNPPFLDLFLSFDVSIYSTITFSLLENSDHVVLSVSIDFPINSKWHASFYCIVYYYFCADWGGLCDQLRDVSWENIFKPGAFADATSEFCEWFQDGIDIYIAHCKYQVKPHSSPWFSTASAAAIVYRNHFFPFARTE